MSDQMDGADGSTFTDERYGDVETATTTPSLTYVNEHGEVDDDYTEMFEGPMGRRARREIASVIEKWSQSLSGYGPQASLDVFNRHRWEGARHTHSIMSQCAWAVENDDVLSTLADVLEGLMWQKCGFELNDEDQESVWNQWAQDVNLDARLRAIGREMFKVSQVYVGLWWEKKAYQVQDDEVETSLEEWERKKEERDHEEEVKKHEQYVHQNANTPGFIAPPPPKDLEKEERRGNRTRRKTYMLTVPTAMTIFDPTKVIPVGTMMFGRERFAYVADRGEDEAFGKVLTGDVVDDTVLRLIEKKYQPSEADKQHCADIGVDHNRLWLFRKDAVFRHSATKADYERYAAVRLKPVLEVLEMKQHLRASDRAVLIGNTNFIVVITKGTDKHPAKPAEIGNLQEQARTVARLPVLVGDHRLNVEIVAPPLDHTLSQARWETLDARLVHRALRTYAPVGTAGAQGGTTGISEMGRVIANALQSERHMVVRTLEARIFMEILERNAAVRDFDEFPTLTFRPKRISLDFDKDVIAGILKLRDRGDISRETTLEELDFDQVTEVLRRAQERVIFDPVFESGTPHSSPAMNPYGVSQPPPPGMPPPQGAPPAQKPGANVGPKGQPRTEGGRPAGVVEDKPRKRKT